jgi:enoyl-CoA hydratase
VSFGVGGVEYFAHPWELGPRKAKEMLFTGDWVSAEEAHRLGMVNHVVPVEDLADRTLAMAQKIAAKGRFALKLAKESVNAMEDAQGRVGAINTAFALHQLAHTHNLAVHGLLLDPSGLPPATARAVARDANPTR